MAALGGGQHGGNLPQGVVGLEFVRGWVLAVAFKAAQW